MTTAKIQTALKKAGKSVGLTQIYAYLRDCGIKPLGIRQRPQQYPADSAERILKHLGFAVSGAGGANLQLDYGKIISTAALRRAAKNHKQKASKK